MIVVVALVANEVLLVPDGRDLEEHFGERATLGPSERLLEDGAVLGLGAAPVCGSALLQRFDERLVEITYEKLTHAPDGRGTGRDINDITTLGIRVTARRGNAS